MSEVSVREPDGLGRSLALRSPTEPRCKVCKLETSQRGQIDRMLISGAPITEIEFWVNEWHHTGIIALSRNVPSRLSISNHAKKHLPLKDMAVRRIIEKRAVERKQDIENGVDNLINEVATAEIIYKKGLSQLLAKDSEVSVRDTLAAAKLVHDFTKDSEGSLDVAQMFSQLSLIIQAVKEIVSPEQYEAITNRIDELSGQEVLEAESDDEFDNVYEVE